MEKLQISFKFLENVIIHYNQDNEPIYGDIIRVEINKQIFQKKIKTKSLKTGIIDERKRAMLFGEALKEIGNEIMLQAVYGKPRKIINNNREVIFF